LIESILNIAPVEKTLNRLVFTIYKACFLNLLIPFPLNLAGLSSLSVKNLNFEKEEVRRGLFISPTKSEYWSTSKVDDYYLKEWITPRIRRGYLPSPASSLLELFFSFSQRRYR
jgi:hypothetical protein